jgi:hypothetical protein
MQTKFKIIETPEYLLAVSDKEIKELDTVYNQIPNSIKKVKSKEELNLVKTINERANEIQKIIAYQPKGNAPELDLPLLPEMVVEPRGFDEFEYTEEDLRKAFRAGSSYAIGSHTDFKQTHLNEKNYIKSLKTPKTPEWFVAEAGKNIGCKDPMVCLRGCTITTESCKQPIIDFSKLKTTTNSEGKQVLVGTYLFE